MMYSNKRVRYEHQRVNYNSDNLLSVYDYKRMKFIFLFIYLLIFLSVCLFIYLNLFT